MDSIPRRTFSANTDSPSSTTTERTDIAQDAIPLWRHPNFPLAPTTTPVQDVYRTQVADNAVNGADYTRRLLWQYIQTGALSSEPPEIQDRCINPQLLLVPDPDPIEYVQRPEFRNEWKASPILFTPTISVVSLTKTEEIKS